MNLPLLIARRYLSKQKGAFSSFIIKLAIVATSLSVAVMILAVCVTGGFKQTIRDKIYSFWGHMVLVPFNENPANIITPKPINFEPKLLQSIQQMGEVSWVAPFVVRPAIIQSKGQMEGLRLKGVDSGYPLHTSLNLEGRGIAYSGDTAYAKEIIISRNTANKLLIRLGDDVLFYFLESGATLPRIRKLRVVGIYHTGMEDVDQYLAMCDIRLLQHINNWSADQINGYQIMLHKEDQVAAAADYLFQHTELTPQTLNETFPGIMDWLAIQNLSVKILLTIMAIVAMISLGAALLILIVERAAITGLLKALGMDDSGVQRIFLYIALLTGGLGVLLGNAMALTLVFAQRKWGFLKLDEATYFMDKVPMDVDLSLIVLVDLATLLVTIVCMWLPTVYVRKMQPAKVLQFK